MEKAYKAWSTIERRRQLSRVRWLWDNTNAEGGELFPGDDGYTGNAADMHWERAELVITNGYLQCAVCGDIALEGGDPPNDVYTYADHDDYEPGNPSSHRGGYTLITVTCAAGHRMALVTGNHKGVFYVELYNVSPKP